MVDVGDKKVTRRRAVATGCIRASAAALAALANNPKGDVLAAARFAAIAAAKRAADWIPLCHPLPLDSIRVDFSQSDADITVTAAATATAKTGVEMEAIVAVQAALVTIYDMLKSADKRMVIGNIHLLEKQGGRSGDFRF